MSRPGSDGPVAPGVRRTRRRRGITLLASSGDQGAAQPSCDGSSWIQSTSSPASDPLVTGVGGTELDAADYCLPRWAAIRRADPAFGTYLGETGGTRAPSGDFSATSSTPPRRAAAATAPMWKQPAVPASPMDSASGNDARRAGRVVQRGDPARRPRASAPGVRRGSSASAARAAVLRSGPASRQSLIRQPVTTTASSTLLCTRSGRTAVCTARPSTTSRSGTTTQSRSTAATTR